MQVTETQNAGLTREYKVTVPAADLETKVNARLDELKGQVQLRGFRPGKVPVAHLKRIYGRSAMAEVIENAIREANDKIVTDNGLKLATEPKVTMPTEETEIESLIGGKTDLAYTVALEVVPPITLGDFKTITLDKPVADVADAEIDEALERISSEHKPYTAKEEGAKAESGDRVTVSFVGRIDGEEFEGGKAEDIAVLLGSNTFIPGFEDQLVGIAAGETRDIKATFPTNYSSEALAGKEAEFTVTAKSVEAPGAVTIDDEFAKSLGMESLDKLKEAIKARIAQEHDSATRTKVKRQLLDQLDTMHPFDPPPTLVNDEFEQIWKTVTSDLESQKRTFEDEETTEEKARADYRKISERRVRLGLVLAEIGEKNKINVTDEEIGKALVERTRQFPGQEQRIWDYYRNTPQALASLRAPIYEEKVVDFLLELAKVNEKKVSKDELFKEEEEEKEKA